FRILNARKLHHLSWLATDVRNAEGGRGTEGCVCLHKIVAVLHILPDGRSQVTLIEILLPGDLGGAPGDGVETDVVDADVPTARRSLRKTELHFRFVVRCRQREEFNPMRFK